MAPGQSGADWAAADGRSGPDRSGAVRCPVRLCGGSSFGGLISPHALPAALTKSGCSENMFRVRGTTRRQGNKERREADGGEGGEAEDGWEKWSGRLKREKFEPNKEEKVKSGLLGKWFFHHTAPLQLMFITTVRCSYSQVMQGSSLFSVQRGRMKGH